MTLTDKLRALADLLDDDEVFDTVADYIVQARDRAPRHSQDRDTGDLLNELIDRLRARAGAVTT